MASKNRTTPTPDNQEAWTPAFTLDLNSASPAAFRALQDSFGTWRKDQPRPDLKLPDGWHEFTPRICEMALILNAGNRQVSFATVDYYAKQMLAGEWQETGQPAIFDVNGNLVDFQHRAWAAYLSGSTVTTYVVNQRKAIHNGFAYIDNSKARSVRDALYTAGLNGLSSVLAQVAKLSWQDESGALTPTVVHKVDKMTPRDTILYVEARPNLRHGVRLMSGDHAAATAVIGYPDVAGYMAFLILVHHDEATLDDFMEQLAEEGEAGSPIAAFQTVMAHDKLTMHPMKRHMVLGYLIKCFNSWVRQEPVRKLSLKVNENFPRVVSQEQQEQQEAAE